MLAFLFSGGSAMTNVNVQAQPVGGAADGPCALESKLRHL
jgi:hypothetical protein